MARQTKAQGEIKREPDPEVPQRAVAVEDAEAHTADVDLAPPAQVGEPLEEAIARIRRMRKPFGAYTQKLALPVRPGYHRHWFNDTAGRVDDAKESGWSHIIDKDGKPLKRVVGTGRDNGVLIAYAMELPLVFWEEDMAARHAAAKAKVDAIKKQPFMAKPGQAQPEDKGKFYSPVEESGRAPLEVTKT